jgi:hypothetical protein
MSVQRQFARLWIENVGFAYPPKPAELEQGCIHAVGRKAKYQPTIHPSATLSRSVEITLAILQ